MFYSFCLIFFIISIGYKKIIFLYNFFFFIHNRNGGYSMNKDEYQKLVEEFTPKEKKFKNAVLAFLVGGAIGIFGQVVVSIFVESFGMEMKEACVWLCILMIFIASLFTALGFFDNWVSKCKAGLFLPTTGFAHSITSSALDYRRDGFITGLGANFFKLAGSVILYGMVSAFFLSILGVIIYG